LFAGADVATAQLQIHEEIRRRAEQAPLSMQFRERTAEECRQWQRLFSAKLRDLLGPHAPPPRWQVIRKQSTDLQDHRREELILRAEGHSDLPVHLLTPRAGFSGKRPGILALHGHGPFGHDPVAGIATTAALAKNIEDFNYHYGLELVRQGYVVAAPCFTPFGRRLDDPKSYRGQDPCAITFVRMQLLGKLLMAENLRDALWSLQLLAQHEQVDPERIGCVGLSYGGRMTMLTSALAPQIRVAVISGALNLMQERISGRYSCGAQVIPGLLNFGDVPEIASLIAPRPCLWEVGAKDPLIPQDRVEAALERLRRAYRAFDALHHVDVDRFDGGHRWSGVKAYPLLAKVLKPV